MKKVKPISPGEAKKRKSFSLHPTIIELVNEHLTKHAGASTITMSQDALVEKFMQRHPHFDREKLFTDKMLDIESTYERSGWIVEYDSPGYNESYRPSWSFEPRPEPTMPPAPPVKGGSGGWWGS